MAAVSSPISKAVKKISKNPEKYLKQSTIKNLSNGGELVKSATYKFSTQLFKLGADFGSAIPKALLTCALIPPLMACFFPKREKMQNKREYPSQVICFKANIKNNKANDIYKSFKREG